MIKHETLPELKHVSQVCILAVSSNFVRVVLIVSYAIYDTFPSGLAISLNDFLNNTDETTAPWSNSIAL